jgi:hypothetical protein
MMMMVKEEKKKRRNRWTRKLCLTPIVSDTEKRQSNPANALTDRERLVQSLRVFFFTFGTKHTRYDEVEWEREVPAQMGNRQARGER